MKDKDLNKMPLTDYQKAFLQKQLELVEGDWQESHKSAKNSYGTGYDRGYLDALKFVLEELSN